MDFQKILELASKNQKVAEKTRTKRYSSKVPPPKKETRPAVDPDAIRARIDNKEKERQQKLIDDERNRKEGAERQVELDRRLAEEKRNNRRASRKSKPSPDPKSKRTPHSSSGDSSRRGETSGYRDKEHEVVHKSFMNRVDKEADKHREKLVKKETAARPSKPKPSKKAPPAAKKPMSYEELLKFAEQQKAGIIAKRDEVKEEEEDDSEEDEESDEESDEEEYDSRPRGRDMGSFNRNREQSRESKMKERLKQERSRNMAHGSNHKHLPAKHGKAISQNFNNKDRNTPSPSLAKGGKGPRQSSEAERNIMRKSSGPINRDRTNKDGRGEASRKPAGDRSGGGGEDKRKMNGSVLSRAGGKHPNRTGERPVSKASEKTSGSGDKRPVRPTEPQAGRSSDKLPRRPDKKLSARPEERPQGRPQGRPESRPVPGKSSRPTEDRDGRERDRSRPVNHDRERPRSSGMGPSRGQEVMRKRPAKPPVMHVKRGRIMVSDSEESDYDDGDGFIDDTPMDAGRGDVSSYIKEIFGYDKSRYGYESDFALRAMDTSYKDIQREESRSARLGMMEDMEDMRQEKEDMKRKASKKGKKR